MPELSDRDRAILQFEEAALEYRGSKEAEIRRRFGLSAGRYYQIVNGLIRTPEALQAYPVTVHRLADAAQRRIERRRNRHF